jgi:hypothetical protein
MRSRIHPGTRILVVAAAAVMALVGCSDGSGNAGNGGGASPTASAPADAAYRTALEFAKCMRTNGHPNFPDPIEARGEWTFPETGENVEAPAACDAVARQQKQNVRDPEPTVEEMTKLRQFATCMREKGFPTYPDPDAQGNFPLAEDLRAIENDQPMRDAEKACESLLPPRPEK